MAIKSCTGAKLTARRKAAELLILKMTEATYSLYDDRDLSEKEKDEIMRHMDRYKERVEKLLGFEPGTWGWD